ncbi:MAG: mandelate racemase/muconate lactonizing enzyme family protein [Firmicutes bacterium]|jgi:L-alanine-DL-glutamate epimerase-like enolase superfamily enzyme|nr:mandelate racemase/muconate lactonizing enzyme family protein [Bacillota bacterium]
MTQLKIKKVEIFATGDPNAETVRWAYYMDEIFTTNIICKITTECGLVGLGATIAYTEHDFDLSILEAVKPYLPGLIGKSAHDREAIWDWMASRPNWMAFPTISIIDIALWDLAAKNAKQPLYQFLGAKREKILSYASTPMFDTEIEYMKYIEECIEEGFVSIKVHSYCKFQDDYELIKNIQKKFGDSGIDFLLDVDQQYNREEAYKMAKLLEDFGWGWFEAPLPDHDLVGYKELKEKTTVPLSCGGNTMISLKEFQTGINFGAWTDLRADVTVAGGITPMLKIMALAQANNMRCEVQSWGMTLTQAANLHIMLSHNNCTYFEQAFPYERFEVGSKTLIRTDKEGFVHAPEGYGLGVELDWDEIERTTLRKLVYGA